MQRYLILFIKSTQKSASYVFIDSLAQSVDELLAESDSKVKSFGFRNP